MAIGTVAAYIVVAVIIAAGFLPVITMRNLAARIVLGILAVVLAANAVWALAVGPNAGLTGILYEFVFALALGGLLLLALIGLTGAFVRLLGRRLGGEVRGRDVAIASVLVVVVAVAGLIAFVMAADYLGEAYIFQTRDAAARQSKDQLASRVVDLFEASSAATSTPTASSLPLDPAHGNSIPAGDLTRITTKETAAVKGILALFHPGFRANYDFKMNAYRRPRVADVPLATFVDLALAPNYRSPQDADNWGHYRTVPGGVQKGDTFSAAWGTEDLQSGALPHLVTQYGLTTHSRWEGSGSETGRLFPRGHFRELQVTLIRSGRQYPFETLYAINDDGKWWLVGVRDVADPSGR